MESNDWPCTDDAYSLDTPLGIGGFGIVWKATCLQGSHQGEEVAVKIFDLEAQEDFNVDEI